jgi:two-component system sensor histidine kinase PilS (NtrC family)
VTRGPADWVRRPGPDGGLERRLGQLMGARLALSIVSLGVTLGLEAAGEHFTTAEWRGFYSTVAFAFLATIGYAVAMRRVVHPRRFAAANVVTDLAIVTSLVHFSGGPDSVFPFLYVVVAAYSAFFFDTRGAVGTALLAMACHGAVLIAGYWGWIPSQAIGPPEPAAVLLTQWFVTSGAIAIVAILANRLTDELRRTGEALSRRTSDLRMLQSLHESTVKSLMSGLLTTDGAGRVTSFNPEAERITQRAAEDVMGTPVAEVIPGVVEQVIAHAEEEGTQSSRARMPFVNANGEQLHLGLAAYVLKNAGQDSGGFVVIFQDVTWVVEMEHELRRSERLAAVGELSASIAHEVRNPLAAISGSIQVLRDRGDAMGSGDERHRLMDIVVRETDRLNRLITDFLRYARPGPMVPGELVLAELVEEVFEMFEGVRPGGVALELDVHPDLRVYADEGQLRQVLWNLVLNGSEAMAAGGALRVSARARSAGAPQERPGAGRNASEEEKHASCVEIAVSDSGQGIAPEVLERIFDPFFSTKENGSGLGLAAVHRIVEDHGGSVRLESKQGVGTTVRLRFPQQEDDE